jgi:hypothetical protein
MSDYDTDIVRWSERQAVLLRQHAAVARANDPALDWPNIIEEIESVGRSEGSALASSEGCPGHDDGQHAGHFQSP